MRIFRAILAASAMVGVLSVAGCAEREDFSKNALKTEIIAMLDAQDAAWNAGNIDGFMAHYLASEDLRFASGGKVKRGWQETIDGYKARYPDKATMGKLSFDNLEVNILSAKDAQVFGRWQLTRAHDKPGGLFTLLLQKQNGKWIIISDHTSTDASTDPIITDPIVIDKNFPPTTVELDFASHGSALNGHFYLANGAGPHPTIIMLHGFPGYEKNLDIAQAARRAGFNVLFFHYRGAWGSEGGFSLSNVIEDTLAASKFVRSPDAVKKYRIDPEHITFIGHSMGGFAALTAGAKDKNVGCVVGLSAADYGVRGGMFKGAEAAQARAGFAAYVDGEHLLGRGPLKGTSGKRLLKEIADNADAFGVAKLADQFTDRSVFLVAAKNDTVLAPEIYHKPLVEAFTAQPAVNLTHKVLEGDHSYSWTRLELTRDVVKWLNVNCRA
ncbi:MAG: alpha/beta fold hydrolase [Robiginitomaculum sp.]|nr:alpha/beta fold hydrolase [Robiginitomaculum sp.]